MPVTALLYSKNNILIDEIHPYMEMKLLEENTNDLTKKNRILVDEITYLNLHLEYSSKASLYVYTKNKIEMNKNIQTFNDIDYLLENNNINQTYVIGKDLFHILLNNNCIDFIEIINIDDINTLSLSDICFTIMSHDFKQISNTVMNDITNDKRFYYSRWVSPIHPEMEYLKLLQNVVETGYLVKSRSEDTLSLFGQSIEFDLNKGFPLLTTKKMFFNGIVKELLWFLKGHTNANELKEQKVNIWNGNSSRKYLDSIGLNHYSEGCCGPIYGYQWRHFNAPYDSEKMMPVEGHSGFDQLMNCINLIQNDPTSRRIIMSGWNPCQLKEMCLPPCHVMYQFSVRDEKLSCQMYQRSADLFLGLPFNIASTALLVHLIAKLCRLVPDKIRICIGDAHIYTSHIDNVIKQIKRKPIQFPQLTIDEPEYNTTEQIENWTSENIRLTGYQYHSKLESKMVV
jgi:thymidylate synthase